MLLLVLLACAGVTEDLGDGECVTAQAAGELWCGPGVTVEYSPSSDEPPECSYRAEPVKRWSVGDEQGGEDVLVFHPAPDAPPTTAVAPTPICSG